MLPPDATVTLRSITPLPASVPPLLTASVAVETIGLESVPLKASVPPLTVTFPSRSVSPQRVSVPVPTLISLPTMAAQVACDQSAMVP